MALFLEENKYFTFNAPPKSGSNPYISYLGTPVVMPFEFLNGRELVGNNQYQEYEGMILRAVTVEVNATKNIVKTTVQGRNGTFKEYISDGDYIISLKGVLINETHHEGIDLVAKRRLFKLSKVTDALKVSNDLLNNLGIYEVTVESFSFGSPRGNIIEFSFSLSSEQPLLLQEK